MHGSHSHNDLREQGETLFFARRDLKMPCLAQDVAPIRVDDDTRIVTSHRGITSYARESRSAAILKPTKQTGPSLKERRANALLHRLTVTGRLNEADRVTHTHS